MVQIFNRQLRMIAVGMLAISALAASPALAGGRTPAPPPVQCVVNPNPVTGAAQYTVSGSGFSPGIIVNVYIKDKISTWIVYGGNTPGGMVAANGTFSIGNINSNVFYPSNLGSKTVTVVNSMDKRCTALCTTTFTVK